MRCLFCKKPSHDAKSVEHVIPESLGSKKRILPRGAICDKCNNYFSSNVEKPILSHPTFRNIRAWWTVPTKKGRFPSLLGHVGGTDIAVALHYIEPGNLEIRTEKEKDKPRLEAYIAETRATGDEPAYLFPIEYSPPKKEMSRFLAKMALEALFLRFSQQPTQIEHLIDDPHWDRIRDYARRGNNVPDWPYYERRVFPDETLMRHPATNEWVQAGFGYHLILDKRREIFFAFGFYGMEYVINLGGPSIQGYEEWLNEHDHISPLVELAGTRLVTREEGGELKFYLEEDMVELKRYQSSLQTYQDQWRQTGEP